jgi:hypothetical protein
VSSVFPHFPTPANSVHAVERILGLRPHNESPQAVSLSGHPPTQGARPPASTYRNRFRVIWFFGFGYFLGIIFDASQNNLDALLLPPPICGRTLAALIENRD